jgi:hypothetical protein
VWESVQTGCSDSSSMQAVKTWLIALALLSIPAGAYAQVVNQVDDAGHATTTNRPEPALPQETVPDQPGEVSVPRTVRPRIPSKLAAEINAREAQRRLEQAQLKRKQGLEPLPGERTQVNGTTMVSYGYWRRQEQLRLAVEKAQRRWNQTHRAYAVQAQPPTQASGIQLVRQDR